MKRILTLVAAVVMMLPGNIQAQQNEEVKIGKQNIKLQSRLMTPEALWAMGRIGSCEASPDGSKVVYQVGYYSVKANKSENAPTWIDADTIAFMSGG